MSFGRRLALFFLLIALVPTVALIGILLFVSSDSREGKADARLAAGLRTAVAVHDRRTAISQADAQRLAKDPDLALAVGTGERLRLQRFANRAVRMPRIARIELRDRGGAVIAAAGTDAAVAFGQVGLTRGGESVGALRLSSTSAEQYAEAVKRLTGDEIVISRAGQPLASTVPPPERVPEQDETADLTAGGKEYRGHLLALDPTGQEEVLVLGPRKEGGVLGIGGPATAILILFLAVAMLLAWVLARALTRLHERVSEQAVTDPLTGLWNRRWMGESLEREVARALRFGHEISLVILDVDDFKEINDRLGHLQGDIVLEAVADQVRDVTRSIDVAARYGGDELAVILLETGREGATNLAERLRERTRDMEIPIRAGGMMSVTLSVGTATIPDSADDLESLVDAADRALLRAKRAGKNQIRTAPEEQDGGGNDRRGRGAAGD